MTPPDLAPIVTSRLRLSLMTPVFLQACLAGDWATAEAESGLFIPPDLHAETEIMARRLAEYQANPAYRPWSLRTLAWQHHGQEVLGHIGFHAPPGAAYLKPYAHLGIELGYTVFPAHRRQGIAQEALQAMIAWASTQAPIDRAILSIGIYNTPSLALAQKLGFVPVGQHNDPEDGPEWVYALNLPPADNGE